MTAKKKPAEQEDITISPAMLKWIVGVVGGLLAALVLWWQVWDRIDSRWRLETIQKAKDDQADAAIKGVEAKAAADLAKHKEADRRGDAWTLFVIQDFRAAAETKWAEDCTKEKRPADVCRELDRKATDSRQRATELRGAAMAASKEGP